MKKDKQAYWLIWLAPLLAFPLMINLRIFPFVAPNEEPKWLVLTICALWMGLAAAGLWWQRNTPITFNKPNIPSILLGIFILLLAIGVFIGPNQTEGMIRFAFWFFCITIMLLSIWAMQHDPRWKNALVWSVSIGTFIFALRYWESYFLDYGKPNYNIHVLFSPIGHVNFTGDVLIILLPFLVWVLATKSSPILRVLNWFSVSTLATILLVASSRGALGGLMLAALVSIAIAIKHYPSWKSSIVKPPSILVLTALLASAVVYTNLPYHYRDLARVSATAGKATTDTGKIQLTPNAEQPPLVNLWVEFSPLLGGRTPIFASTTAMTLEAPILGQGTGNYAWVYPSFSNRYPDFRDALSSVRTFTTNPHNVVLQIASQNGIPAMLIFMSLLLYFWYRLLKTCWQQWSSWHLAGLAAITAAIFDAMFNHVFFNPASMFVFALLGGAWWGSLKPNHALKENISIQPKMAASLALITTILLSIWPIRWVVSEWYVGQAMAYAKYQSYEADYYQKAYNWDKENFRAVFGMGQVAYKQKKYLESVRYFEEFEAFYPYNPPALNMLGAAYMVSGQYQKAVDTFKRALKTYPGFEMAEQNLQRAQMILMQQSKQTLPTAQP